MDDDLKIMTMRFNDIQCRAMRVVSLTICGYEHDSSWIYVPRAERAIRSAWTWYSLGDLNAEPLVTNIHGVSEAQTYTFEWDESSEIFA